MPSTGPLEATIAPGLSLGAGGGAGWFSDGNVRTSGVLAVTKQLPKHLFVGGMGRMVWFQEPGVGYFSPNRFTVVEARGGYARMGPTWETRASAGAGVQQIGSGGGWQFEGHVEGRAAYWFADRNRIEAFAGVTNSANRLGDRRVPVGNRGTGPSDRDLRSGRTPAR